MAVDEKRIKKQIQELELKIKNSQAKIKALKKQETEKKRKLRIKALISFGELGEAADLLTADKATVAGLLFKGKEMLEDEITREQLKSLGKKLLEKSIS